MPSKMIVQVYGVQVYGVQVYGEESTLTVQLGNVHCTVVRFYWKPFWGVIGPTYDGRGTIHEGPTREACVEWAKEFLVLDDVRRRLGQRFEDAP